MPFAETAAMRLAFLVPFVCVVGCREQPIAIRAERIAVDASVEEGVADVGDAAEEEAAPFDGGPIPSHTALRARFATELLTVAAHGIDGTFELWRDSRLDDARVAKDWFSGGPSALAGATVTAQLILRDARRRIVESLDLEVERATMTPVRLGDDSTPYLEIAIDGFGGAGRWGGTTHRFVRVEGGRSRWLDCAETYRCSMSCDFHYDKRASGGFDLLVWRHEYEADLMTAITHFTRREIVGGKCVDALRSEPDWVGAEGSKTAIMIPGSFPPPRVSPSSPP